MPDGPLPHPDDLANIEDPIARARACADAVDRYNAALHEAARIRRHALREVLAGNRTLEEVGALLGITRQSVYRAITVDRPATLIDDPAFRAWVAYGDDDRLDDDTVAMFLRPGEDVHDVIHRERARRKAERWYQRRETLDREMFRSKAVGTWLDGGRLPSGAKFRNWASRFLPEDGSWNDPHALDAARAAAKRARKISGAG